jgi:hypothetical protein
MAMSDDRRVAFTLHLRFPIGGPVSPLERLDLTTGVSSSLGRQWDSALPAQMQWTRALPAHVVGGVLAIVNAGIVQVSRDSDREVHLLTGHVGVITDAAISPDLKWVASASEDKTLRLWPMPDLDQPPLHTLPHDGLVAKLKSLTNLRACATEVGRLVIEPVLPGWEHQPGEIRVPLPALVGACRSRPAHAATTLRI